MSGFKRNIDDPFNQLGSKIQLHKMDPTRRATIINDLSEKKAKEVLTAFWDELGELSGTSDDFIFGAAMMAQQMIVLSLSMSAAKGMVEARHIEAVQMLVDEFPAKYTPMLQKILRMVKEGKDRVRQ
jgi:hypothetical protein